jgi:hypothetical protein
MRVPWVYDYADRDRTKSLIDRSKTTMRGHSTRKLYAGNVPSPICRGRRKLPKHVYLDDRACYAIAYSEKYLKAYWPYEFDNLGSIKVYRPSRGRQAYLETVCTEFAKGPLRGRKAEGYEFCGAPVSSGEYAPQWRVKKEAERAHAKKIQNSTQISLSGTIPVTSSPSTEECVVTPGGYPLSDTDRIYPTRPVWKQEEPIGNTYIKYERFTPSRHYESGRNDGSLKLLGITERLSKAHHTFTFR